MVAIKPCEKVEKRRFMKQILSKLGSHFQLPISTGKDERSAKKKLDITVVSIILTGLVIQLGFTTEALCYYKNISTPYYQQQTSYWCGAATAQMVLESEQVVGYRSLDYPTGTTYQIQQGLYNYIDSHNNISTPVNWATDPQGLAAALHHYDARASFTYVQYLDSGAAISCKKLAYTIEHYTVPPSVLIYQGAHWVAVKGVSSSDTPTWNGNYEIYGFYVNDPWYGSNSLGANKYIAYNNWVDCYFTPVSTGSSDPWNGYRVSVCDPDVVTPDLRPPLLGGSNVLMTPEEALIAADTAIHERGLDTVEGFASAWGGGTISAANPFKVKWLCGEDCYSVPYEEDGWLKLVVTVDAYSGHLMEATYTLENNIPLSHFYQRQTYPFLTCESSARPGVSIPSVTPEPATICLLGLGALGLLKKRRA
jgi:hypothetical protein